MFIKNNSKNEWLNYKCGGGNSIDIKANSTFEVSEEIGNFLLRVLGHENWLVKVDKADKIKEQVKEVKEKVAETKEKIQIFNRKKVEPKKEETKKSNK